MAVRAPKLVIVRTRYTNLYWVRLVGRNGRIVFNTETFPTFAHAERARKTIRRLMQDPALESPMKVVYAG